MARRSASILIGISLLVVSDLRSGLLSQAPSGASNAASATVDDAETRAAKSWLNPWTFEVNKQFQIVEEARIFVVPPTMRNEAIALLASGPVASLTDEQASRLLGVRAPTGDQIVDATISDAQTESKISGRPPSAEIAYHAHTLYGKLRPYLVRAVAANAGGRIFFASWQENDLCVLNGSLGGFHYIRMPLIVYLERQPKRVWIEAGSAY
jgi:hypothetical protein